MRYKPFLFVLLLSGTLFSQATTIVASRPTHYLFTPTAYVNEPYHLVLGFREISYAFPGNLQIQASLFDNIGRINLGAKYGVAENMAIGAGMAHSLMYPWTGGHGIRRYHSPRFGIFFTLGVVQNPEMEAALTFHSQIGNSFSVGCDFGLKYTPVDVWSFMAEVGTSFNLSEPRFYLNTIGGIRIHPPNLPFLNFDLGINLTEFSPGSGVNIGVYIDFIFAMITM
ncbi:hypothetical protein CHISP_2484 [Chitinispirillum alkaliphilum]|nr:hypothetical protein CHISP_2484 [Chitinispirillum alkaliphilum]